MGAVVACGSCGRRFQVGARKAGKTIPCPNCGADIFVPPAGLEGELDLGGADDPSGDGLGSLLGPAPRAASPAPTPAPRGDDIFSLAASNNLPAGSSMSAPLAAAPTAATPPGTFPLQASPLGTASAAGAPGSDPLAAPGHDFGLNAPYSPGGPSADPLMSGGAGMPGLPANAKARFKPIKPAPDWYANPAWLAALIVPLIALIYLVIMFTTKSRAIAAKAAAAASSEAASSGSHSGGSKGGANSGGSTGGSNAGPPLEPGNGFGVGPVGQEVTAWKALLDPQVNSVTSISETAAVPVARDAPITFSQTPGSVVAVHDSSEPNRVLLWDLQLNRETASWRGLANDSLAEALSSNAGRYACVVPSPAGLDLVVATKNEEKVQRAYLPWSATNKEAPPLFGFIGDNRVVIAVPSGDPIAGREIEVWTVGNGVKFEKTIGGFFPRERSGFALSSNGLAIAMFTPNSHLEILSTSSGETVGEAIAVELKDCRGMAFSTDGGELAAIFASGQLAVWDMTNGKRVSLQTTTASSLSPRTAPLQPLAARAGWLVYGSTLVYSAGDARTLFSDATKQPAYALGGKFLFTVQQRDGVDYFARDTTTIVPAK